MSRRTKDIQDLVDFWFDTSPDLLAVHHFEIDPRGSSHADVLLMQITRATPPSPNEVIVYGFAPGQDFPYPMSLAQITPDEWARIQSDDLALPLGWDMNERCEIVQSRRAAVGT